MEAPVRIVTRVVVQPAGGGEPIETFDSTRDETEEVDTLLAAYSSRFSPPTELALTSVPGVTEPVAIGWVFRVPENFEVPGSREEFEMVLIPMFDNPGTGERLSVFATLAEERSEMRALFDEGVLDELHEISLHQREPESGG